MIAISILLSYNLHMLKICGLTKTTLLDYPGKVAATIFLGGCNFRCGFCHNASLALFDLYSQSATINNTAVALISESEIFDFLEKRKNILQGVCISGGEPTLQKYLPDFIQKIKSYGLAIKLDTNGYNADMLSSLLNDNLLDMVSMDIKCSKDKYSSITEINGLDISRIEKSINLLCDASNKINVEFRTTIVDEFFTEQTFHDIGKWISSYNNSDIVTYYLQAYLDSENTIKKGFHSPTEAQLLAYLNIIRSYIPNSYIRGENL